MALPYFLYYIMVNNMNNNFTLKKKQLKINEPEKKITGGGDYNLKVGGSAGDGTGYKKN